LQNDTVDEGDSYPTGKVPSYTYELGYNVSNKLKLRISNGQYVNLAKLLPNMADPDYDTQYISVKDGNLATAKSSKPKAIKDVQVWTDVFLTCARYMPRLTLRVMQPYCYMSTQSAWGLVGPLVWVGVIMIFSSS
jgi:hypothetical protein